MKLPNVNTFQELSSLHVYITLYSINLSACGALLDLPFHFNFNLPCSSTIVTTNHSEFEVNACKQDPTYDIKWGQDTTGIDFASDWLRNLRAFCYPITERSKVKTKPKQT